MRPLIKHTPGLDKEVFMVAKISNLPIVAKAGSDKRNNQ